MTLQSKGEAEDMTPEVSFRRRRAGGVVATLAMAILMGVLAGCADDSATSTVRDAASGTSSVTTAGSTTSVPTARPPLRESDVAGLTAHESVAEMVSVLNEHGIVCRDLTLDAPLYDDGESGTCIEPSESGIPIEIYGSFEHLAEGVAGIEGLLTLGSPWIPNYAIGKNWTAICGQPEACESLADVLGGTARTTK